MSKTDLAARPMFVRTRDAIEAQDIKIRPASDPSVPVILCVHLTGQSRGGDITARPPRRKSRSRCAASDGVSAVDKIDGADQGYQLASGLIRFPASATKRW